MRLLGFVGVLSLLMVAGSANAQPQQQQDKSNSQFDLKKNPAGQAEADAARGRMRAGDCAGALTSFDEALKTSQEIELVRDRGLCHDKLGNKFPALEDLRAYLAAKPDAVDAEAIRARVQQLEAGTASTNTTTNTVRATKASKESDVDVYAANREDEDKKRRQQPIGAKPGEKEHDYSYYVTQERLLDEANESPLRYGSGLVLGAFVGFPRYFFANGGTSDPAYLVGARLGYSTGKFLTLYGEAGLGGVGKSGEITSTSGPIFALGAEGRIGISKRASDQILLRLGLGYEHYVTQGTRAITHVVPARFALGYRHVFSKAVGLEVVADGGPALFVNEAGDSSFAGVIGGTVAFVVGF